MTDTLGTLFTNTVAAIQQIISVSPTAGLVGLAAAVYWAWSIAN